MNYPSSKSIENVKKAIQFLQDNKVYVTTEILHKFLFLSKKVKCTLEEIENIIEAIEEEEMMESIRRGEQRNEEILYGYQLK